MNDIVEQTRAHLRVLLASPGNVETCRVLGNALCETERLIAVNEHDRTHVADGIEEVMAALKSREWLRLGRGSYEWDDDRWKDEFGEAFDEIVKAMDRLRTVAGDFSDCPSTQAAVFTARANMFPNQTTEGGE